MQSLNVIWTVYNIDLQKQFGHILPFPKAVTENRESCVAEQGARGESGLLESRRLKTRNNTTDNEIARPR